jgi:hypothetical protein
MRVRRLALLLTVALFLIPASSGGADGAPETILSKRPTGAIHAPRATFRFNANIAGSTFQCKLDRRPFRACESPKTYKGLSEGRHVFRVRAVGPTGLVDPTPGVRNIRVVL